MREILLILVFAAVFMGLVGAFVYTVAPAVEQLLQGTVDRIDHAIGYPN